MPVSFAISANSVVAAKEEIHQYLIVNTSFMVQSDEDKAADLDNPDTYFSPHSLIPTVQFLLVPTAHLGHLVLVWIFILSGYPPKLPLHSQEKLFSSSRV